MTDPYWTDGKVTLHLGDCRDVTAWLIADVLVTDPPYGRRWRQGNTKANRPTQRPDNHDGIAGDADTGVRDEALALWGDGDCAAVFGDLMLAPPADAKHVLIWRKPPCGAGFRGAVAGFRRDAEAVYLIGPWPTGLGGQTSVITSGTSAQSGASGVTARYGHPTPNRST